MTDILLTDPEEFLDTLAGMDDAEAATLSVGQLRSVGREMLKLKRQTAHLEDQVYTKEGRWPRYIWTGWECGECGFRTHFTTNANSERCPQCNQGWAWTKVYWRRDDKVETREAGLHLELNQREQRSGSPVNAIASMNHHIEKGHKGPWGDCLISECVEVKEKLPRG